MKKQVAVSFDKLIQGESEEFDELLSPEFLDLAPGDDIAAEKPVHVEGSAYLADDYCILDFSVEATLRLTCSLCNETFEEKIFLPHCDEQIAVGDVTGRQLDVTPYIREALLLNVPFYPQCGGKVCLNRKDVERYLRPEGEEEEEATYNPFKDL